MDFYWNFQFEEKARLIYVRTNVKDATAVGKYTVKEFDRGVRREEPIITHLCQCSIDRQCEVYLREGDIT